MARPHTPPVIGSQGGGGGSRRYARRTTNKRQYPRLARGPLQSTTSLTPFARLALAHGAGVCGDVFVTVALADSVFFGSATSAARGKILLYLVLTMAPFAVIAPVLGPLLDRSKGGRRLILMLASLGRAGVCIVMANHIHDLYLYPLAFMALVLSKTQAVTKGALVPAVVEHEDELVKANSRLALMSILAGTLGAPFAGLILKVLGGDWVLRAGAIVFLGAAVLALGVPRARRAAPDETVAQREALHAPTIIRAGTAMGFLRGVVGFMTFFGAIVLKHDHYGAKEFGLLIAASAVGNGLGTALAPILRRRVREEWILVGVISAPSLLLVFAARAYSIPALSIAALIVAASAACGRLAFDSLVQRDASDAARGRAFARFETRFQLVWVSGGVLACVFPTNGRAGLFLIAIVMLFAGFAYLGSVRRAEPDEVGTVES